MTTMLERAARAAGDIQVGVDEGGEAVFAGPHVGLALARAVLMAVRNGSPEIFSAMDRAQPLWPSSQCDSRLELERSANEPRVRAMIDAILEGK